MNYMKIAAIAALGSLVAACGGNGNGDGGGDAGAPSSGSSGTSGSTSFTAATPAVGTTDVFVTATVDDSNNTINATYTQRVARINTDGSYAVTQIDPTNDSVVVDGIDYRFNPTTLTFDGQGHELTADATLPNGNPQDCTFTTTSGGHTPPWVVGQTWSETIHEVCAPGANFTVTGNASVVGVEQVTVPAGTFSALKLHEVQTWTDDTGQDISEDVTHWVDPARSLFTLKKVIVYTRSGTVPAHYVTSETIELQSRPVN